MKKSLTAKEIKELKQNYGPMAESLDEYHDHIDFRCLENFDDKAFAFVMVNVKGVNMLDLNETYIGNESISFLTGLEYVNELRAKECYNLNNDCTTDLNKITSLIFLHLKNTGITIDGLLNLKDLTNLKTLTFSADDVDAIKQKLLQLKTILPSCEIVVNSKPYYVNGIDLFINSLQQLPFIYRLKIKNQNITDIWSNTINKTPDNKIDVEGQENYLFEDIEWVEINTLDKNTKENPVVINESENNKKLIALMNILEFPYMMDNGIISVYIVNKEI